MQLAQLHKQKGKKLQKNKSKSNQSAFSNFCLLNRQTICSEFCSVDYFPALYFAPQYLYSVLLHEINDFAKLCLSVK